MKASPYEKKIELKVTRQDKDLPEVTYTDFVKIPKSSIVEYWLNPNTNTERISVEVKNFYTDTYFCIFRESEQLFFIYNTSCLMLLCIFHKAKTVMEAEITKMYC